MTSGSMEHAGPALIVQQIGEYDRATGAVTYQATVDEGEPKLTLSFTGPRDGVVVDLGYGMFRYTPNPRSTPTQTPSRSSPTTVVVDRSIRR